MTSEIPDNTSVESTESVQEAPVFLDFKDFMKVELKVGTVVEADVHPNADRLLKLQVDVGEAQPRQICAGIREFYSPEDMLGKQIIVVANLAPRKIRGEMSNGMLLAASDESGESRSVCFVSPSAAVPAGSSVG